ncbi:hypothetical protein FRX31_010188, partial [Thalictrum thalictroides]
MYVPARRSSRFASPGGIHNETAEVVDLCDEASDFIDGGSSDANLDSIVEDDYDSLEDEDYIVDSDYEVIVNEPVTTRSKGKTPDIDIDRCDAVEEYESPWEYSCSEEEDDGELREDEIQWAKDLCAADAREYPLRRAEERAKLIAEKGKKVQEKGQSAKGKEKVTSDEEWIQKTSRIEDYDNCEWPNVNLDEDNLPVLEVDQRWYNIYKCRSYLKTYAIRRKFVLGLIKNDSDRIQACCKGVGPDGEACSWYCSLGRMTDKHTKRVGVLHKEHTCVSYELIVNPTANAAWIAEQVESDMRMHHRTYK